MPGSYTSYIAGNQENEGHLLINQSLTDDSSVITGSESEPDVDLNDMNPSDDDSTHDTEAFSVAEVFDPDKDRDSMEDLREDATTIRFSNDDSAAKGELFLQK